VNEGLGPKAGGEGPKKKLQSSQPSETEKIPQQPNLFHVQSKKRDGVLHPQRYEALTDRKKGKRPNNHQEKASPVKKKTDRIKGMLERQHKEREEEIYARRKGKGEGRKEKGGGLGLFFEGSRRGSPLL